MKDLISSQRHTNQEIVDQKIASKDFDVFYVNFSDDYDFSIVVDGHHSLEAARQAGVEPNFIDATDMDGFEKINLTFECLNYDLDALLETLWMGDEWYDVKTGKLYF